MSRPLRLGVVCYPSVGGSGIVASLLGEELAARGHEVHFISYERPFRLPADAPRVWFHPVWINNYELFRYPDYTLPLSVKMAEVAEAHALDLWHVHYAVPHATAALLARDMLPPDRRPRIVTTLHGTDTTLLARDPGYAPAIRHALEKSDGVTTVSRWLRDETQRLLQVQRPIEVVPNFFTPRPTTRTRDAVRRELGVAPAEPLLVHLSNLRPVKRIDLLLAAFARLDPALGARLLVLAGGDFGPHFAAVQRLGLRDRVIVREKVADVENYLHAADVGLFTSESESFCLSILEAMSLGCPCVSTRVGGIPEVMEDGVHGRFSTEDSPAAVAAALTQVLTSPGLRGQLARAGQARAVEVFSAAAVVPRYETFYRRVLGEG